MSETIGGGEAGEAGVKNPSEFKSLMIPNNRKDNGGPLSKLE